MRKVIVSIVSITSLLLLPAAAQAWWGPGGECGRPNAYHCYSLTAITPSKPNRATILQVVDEGSDVADWNEGGYETQEEWILWPSKYGSNAWEEMGQIIGHGSDCCTLHPFQFEQTPQGVDHEWFPQNVPNPGYADYMIYNLEGTTWDFFWGSPGGTNTKGQPSPVEAWYEEGYQWGAGQRAGKKHSQVPRSRVNHSRSTTDETPSPAGSTNLVRGILGTATVGFPRTRFAVAPMHIYPPKAIKNGRSDASNME